MAPPTTSEDSKPAAKASATPLSNPTAAKKVSRQTTDSDSDDEKDGDYVMGHEDKEDQGINDRQRKRPALSSKGIVQAPNKKPHASRGGKHKISKDEFERRKAEILELIPNQNKDLFGEVGFARWSGVWYPALVVNPYDVEPDSRKEWIKNLMSLNTKGKLSHVQNIVYWYEEHMYSFVGQSAFVTYEQGKAQGLDKDLLSAKEKVEKQLKGLDWRDEIRATAFAMVQEDLAKPKHERKRGFLSFKETFEDDGDDDTDVKKTGEAIALDESQSPSKNAGAKTTKKRQRESEASIASSSLASSFSKPKREATEPPSAAITANSTSEGWILSRAGSVASSGFPTSMKVAERTKRSPRRQPIARADPFEVHNIDDLVSLLPKSVAGRFGEVGFSKWCGKWRPALIMNPLNVSAGVQVGWMIRVEKLWKSNIVDTAPFVVYWYENGRTGECYGYIRQNNFVSFEVGKAKGLTKSLEEAERTAKEGKNLSLKEQGSQKAYSEMLDDLEKHPSQRVKTFIHNKVDGGYQLNSTHGKVPEESHSGQGGETGVEADESAIYSETEDTGRMDDDESQPYGMPENETGYPDADGEDTGPRVQEEFHTNDGKNSPLSGIQTIFVKVARRKTVLFLLCSFAAFFAFRRFRDIGRNGFDGSVLNIPNTFWSVLFSPSFNAILYVVCTAFFYFRKWHHELSGSQITIALILLSYMLVALMRETCSESCNVSGIIVSGLWDAARSRFSRVVALCMYYEVVATALVFLCLQCTLKSVERHGLA